MLLAERPRAAPLQQIIKELQRHRLGRRAETMPENQLLLGLEDVEQVKAISDVATDAANEVEPSRTALREQRGAAGAHAEGVPN